jgi:hypothetical protein
VVLHEITHVVGQTQKASESGICGWFGKIHDRSDFRKRHRSALFTDLSPDILDEFHAEFALFRLQQYVVFAEALEYGFQPFEKLVVSFTVYYAVVKIHFADVVDQAC